MLYESGKVGYIATLILKTSFWNMWHPLFPGQTIFYFPTSIVNHFCNKILSAQRNIRNIQILNTVPPPKRGFFKSNFLFVRGKHHTRVRSVSSSSQVMV